MVRIQAPQPKCFYQNEKIIVLSFITLDGIMQAPGGPTEDISGGFKYGGWTISYSDEFSGKEMSEQMSKPADLLLGRKTFEIFASYWPQYEGGWPTINKMTKYITSNTLSSQDWQNTVFLKSVEDIKKVKNQVGHDLQVYGSSNLIQTILAQDLVDEFWLKIFLIILGTGKRLFDKGTIPTAFKLSTNKVSPSGVIIANYERVGEVRTGSF